MTHNLCSRGVYGCKHDEGRVSTAQIVLKYFKDHNGYVLSRDLNGYFGCCTKERTDALSTVLSHLQYSTNEIRHISASALGLVGSEHPKAQKQERLIFKEAP